MYTIHDYAGMISDRGRTDAYASALRKRITPESVVLDLGTGPGILALLACQYGARKVYAIESADILQIARECAAAAGFADRIELIPKDSTHVVLPEKVHGIVSDLHGIFLMFGRSLFSILDARDRFLASGGWMIPSRETLWVSAASFPRTFRDFVGIWTENPYELSMRSARSRAVNQWSLVRDPALGLMTRPACWAVLDYATLAGPNIEGRVELEVETPGEAHGLCVWFDCETADGIGFSGNPASGESHIYGQGVFPWPEPVQLTPGDLVSVTLKAHLIGTEYLWRWATDARSADGRNKAAFSQNTFAGSPILPERLRRRAHSYVPELNEEGKTTLAILQRMAAGVRLEEIARELAVRYPHLYARWEDALTRVGELSTKYSL